MTRSEFAQHRRVSKAAVTQWAAAGRIKCDAEGNVLVEESEQILAATQNTRGGKRGPKKAPDLAGDEREPHQYELDEATLTGARTAQARARAKLDEMELAERAGKLVERQRYDQAVADALTPILARFDSISMRAAPKLLGQTDVRRIQDVIDDAVLEARQDISDTLRAMIASGEATKQ